MAGFFFNIDVLGMGACNLLCPSCPIGNSRDVRNPRGLMEPDLLDRILAKATAECEIIGVGLFNWTEPLLHPRLDELIAIVHKHALSCDLSTNLNNIRNIEKPLRQNPAYLRISNSGFHQATYGFTHRGGNIEQVKRNMAELMELKHRIGSTTRVDLHFHRYAHNLDDEVEMRAFCEDLGIGVVPVNAFFMPVEKLISHIDNDPTLAKVTDEDREIMQRLIIPIDEAMELVKPHRNLPCVLQENQITMDFRGEVQLCCATYDASKFTLGNYLDHTLAELQAMKYKDSFCTRCMNHGVHVYYTAATGDLNHRAIERTPPQHHSMLKSWPAYVSRPE